MAFTIRRLPYRPWPVTVAQLVSDEAGEVQEVKQTFVAHFRPFTESEYEQLEKDGEAKFPAPADAAGAPLPLILQRNAKLFTALIVGWGKEVQDESGKPIPFSAKTLDAMVTGEDGLPISAALHLALQQLRYGVAPEKNLPISAAPGPSAEPAEAAGTNSTAT